MRMLVRSFQRLFALGRKLLGPGFWWSRALALLLLALASCGDDLTQSELDPDAPIDTPPGSPSEPLPQPSPEPPFDPLPVPPVPPGPPELSTVCGTAPVTLADWERCFLRRSCEVQVHCGSSAHFSDVDECMTLSDAVSAGQQSFATAERARALAAGRAFLDVDMYTDCLLGLSAERCSAGWHAPACELRFAGVIEDRGACYSDIECKSPGAHCTPADCGDSCCLGTCQPRKKLEEPCHGLLDCEPGLMCGRDAHCVSGEVGSRCVSGADCDWDAWCDRQAQECKPNAREGELCKTFLQCGGETACVGLFRPVQPPRCQRVTQAGDPCDGDCLGNLYCKMPPTGFGVCTSLPVHGEGCSLLLSCAGANEICEQGVCVERRGPDEPCSGGDCRRGLACASPTNAGPAICQELLADGKLGCRRPEECASHICSGDANRSGVCQPYRATCP